MFGKSFVLIKPDGVKKKLVEKIVQSIQDKNIWVMKREEIYLSKCDIMNIWPYAQSDVVSRQLLFNYLLDEKCILLYLLSSEENMYKIISDIKKSVRKKYGVHQYMSVLHSPASIEEYIKDIKIFQKKTHSLVPNKTIVGEFECYKDLKKQDVFKLCQRISEYMNGGISNFLDGFRNEIVLILYKNGVNDSYFLMGILSDNLGYSFDISYYIAISVNYYGNFPILKIKDCNYDLATVKELFWRYGFRTEVTNYK